MEGLGYPIKLLAQLSGYFTDKLKLIRPITLPLVCSSWILQWSDFSPHPLSAHPSSLLMESPALLFNYVDNVAFCHSKLRIKTLLNLSTTFPTMLLFLLAMAQILFRQKYIGCPFIYVYSCYSFDPNFLNSSSLAEVDSVTFLGTINCKNVD